VSLWYLVADAVSSFFSGRNADESPYTERPLSIRDGDRPEPGTEAPPATAWDPAPITPEPWIDWKRHGRVVKVVIQVLFVLLAIWLKYWFRSH
jgi:hypothetical protein